MAEFVVVERPHRLRRAEARRRIDPLLVSLASDCKASVSRVSPLETRLSWPGAEVVVKVGRQSVRFEAALERRARHLAESLRQSAEDGLAALDEPRSLARTASAWHTAARVAARKISFAVDKSELGLLADVRQECLRLVVGIDPDAVKTDGASYRYGLWDALAAVLTSLTELASAWAQIADAPDNAELVCWCPDVGVRVLERRGAEWRLAGTDCPEHAYEPTHYLRTAPRGPRAAAGGRDGGARRDG